MARSTPRAAALCKPRPAAATTTPEPPHDAPSRVAGSSRTSGPRSAMTSTRCSISVRSNPKSCAISTPTASSRICKRVAKRSRPISSRPLRKQSARKRRPWSSFYEPLLHGPGLGPHAFAELVDRAGSKRWAERFLDAGAEAQEGQDRAGSGWRPWTRSLTGTPWATCSGTTAPAAPGAPPPAPAPGGTAAPRGALQGHRATLIDESTASIPRCART